MKKVCLTIMALVIASSCVFALTKDEELTKLKDAKNAQDTVINTQIKTYKAEIERITLDASIPDAKKEAIMNQYVAKIKVLNEKKSAIKAKYDRDKAAIKAR